MAADIYSCCSGAIGFNVVPSPQQAVPVSVFDTHSLGRVAQSRLHWHRSLAKLFPCEKMVKTHTKRQKWKEGAEER